MKTRTKVMVAMTGAVIFLCFLLIVFMTANYTSKEARTPPDEMIVWEPSPSPSEDRFGAIDRALEQLEFGNIAFNAPKTMNFRSTAAIQLKLGLEASTNELKRMIEAAGEKEGARIQVSDRMEARLSGPSFSITTITPQTQAVSRSHITEWEWEVEPNSAGRHYLHLTLSALLSVDGVSTPRAIRTFDKLIEVQVTWHQRVDSFFDKNWQWLWAAILVPIVGWLWKKKEAKSETSQYDS